MTDNIERLSEAFTAHEHLTPNPGDVLRRANARARTFRRRRRAAQATGASLLSAGVVATGVIAAERPWQSSTSTGVSVAGVPLASPSPLVTPTSATSPAVPSPTPSPTFSQQQALNEFFNEGYDYNNATALSALWNQPDLAQVKTKAGTLLLEGAKLPVTPNSTPASPQDRDLNAYFDAGYGYNDAVQLGKLWNETDMQQIKTQAGQKLLAGQTLPIPPTGTNDTAPAASGSVDAAQQAAIDAYFAANYTYNDTLKLGKLWNETDVLQIKTRAGQALLAGQKLPIAP